MIYKKISFISGYLNLERLKSGRKCSYIGTLKIIVMFYFLTLKVSALVFLLLFLKIHVYLEYILRRTVKKGKRNK